MRRKPYPRPPVVREPSLVYKRMLDTNVLIDHLYEREDRHAAISPWLLRPVRRAPNGRVLIPDFPAGNIGFGRIDAPSKREFMSMRSLG